MNKELDTASIERWHACRRDPQLFAQLPEAWRLSLKQHHDDAIRRRKLRQRHRILPISILTSLAALTPPKVKSAPTIYTSTLTGTDSDTAYKTSTDANGNLVYGFANGDMINVESAASNVYGVAITSSSSSVVLDTTAGNVSILATRDVPSSGTTGGAAVGVYVSSPQSDPKSITINGSINVTAVDNNSWTQRIGGTIYGNAYALWADNYGSITINGNTTLKASTPGYGRVIYLTGNGSSVTINGNLIAESDSNSTDYAIEQDGRGVLKVTGNVDLTADGVYPSDNVNGIWNESVSAHTEIDGYLKLYAIAHGSTVMGIRNNGYIYVGGPTTITAIGNRSAYGVNAGHRLSKTIFNADATISAQGGTATYGDTTGVYNYGGNGGNGYMLFKGNLAITATDGTFEGDSDVYGLNNAGNMSLSTAGTTAQIQATGTQGSHSAYGIYNSLSLTAASNVAITVSEVAGATYGIVNTGTADFTGSLSVAKAASSTAASNYGVITRSSGSSAATTNINQGESNQVTIQGDVLTGSSNGYIGTLNLNLDTSGSELDGLVLADTDGSVGQANVSLSHGASWIVTGADTVATDFGTGSLTVGTGSAIDMAASWGSFSADSVPSHSFRVLQINSTADGGASVNLADGAVFTLLSDVRNSQADEVVFGSGITSFTSKGTLDVRIAYDPVLNATSWISASALQNGVTITAPEPIVIMDASAAAGGKASFQAAQGLVGQWDATYENALVRFSYRPQVSVSTDGKEVLLTGIQILGSGSSSSGGSGGTTSTPPASGTTSSGSSPGNDTSGSTGTDPGTGNTGTVSRTGTGAVGTTVVNTGTSITPSTGVMVAADAARTLSNVWQIDDESVDRRSESLRSGQDDDAVSLWTDTNGGTLQGDTEDGRTYRQSENSLSLGIDRRANFDQGYSATGLVYTHDSSHADLQNGRADMQGDSVGLYSTWVSNQGAFADVVARVGQLRNSYVSADAFGTVGGRYRASSSSLSLRIGRRFQNRRGGYIEPQLQAAYGSVGPSSYSASNDVRFDVDKNHTFLSRAGVLAGQAFSLSSTVNGDLYARVSMTHTLGDRPNLTASLDGGSLPVALPARHATTADAALGAHMAIAGRWGIFAEFGSASRSGTIAGGWHAGAGLRLSF